MQPAVIVTDLNTGTGAQFVDRIGPVFEHSPWIAEDSWNRRPFRNLSHLHESLCETVQQAGTEKQLALICAHPDLVGRAALAGTLTQASTSEQAGAGLTRLSTDEIALFQTYNQQYRDKFGFPFVICARLNKKETILEAFPRRLKNSREDEIRAALNEIYKIAWFRLQDIVSP